jgi:peptidoglycan-associated lipoprotein
MQMTRIAAILVIVLAMAPACAKKKPPVAVPTAPPPAGTGTTSRPPEPPTPVTEPQPVPVEPTAAGIDSRDLDEINKNSPFQPLFFGYDESEISAEGQQVLNGNAEIMKKNSTWVITIEGHADERGTAEYNLALGERRALAARNYLVSLGIPAERLRTVSYGKEFPFDPGHTEDAWKMNRRAHFVVTSK